MRIFKLDDREENRLMYCMHTIIKFRCQTCMGKLSADEEFYQGLRGKKIKCPHCGEKADVPEPEELDTSLNMSAVPPAVTKKQNQSNMTQQIQLPPPAPKKKPLDIKRSDLTCPNCGTSIGAGDRICIMCETKLNT